MPRAFRRRRFGTRSRSAVTQSTCILARKAKCRGCGGKLAKGDTAARLRLKKSFQAPCTACGHKPAKLKYFHPHCVPADINKAMGYDPAANTAAHTHVPPSAGGAVPPPPKPKSIQDLSLEALSSLEAALIAKSPALGINAQHTKAHPAHVAGCKACEVEKAFKTYQNIKARVLRPGTPAEGETATTVALKRIIDLVFT